MIVARILGKGQVVIPKKIRDHMGVSSGDKVQLHVTKGGVILSPFRKNYTAMFKGRVKGKLTMAHLDKLYAEKSE